MNLPPLPVSITANQTAYGCIGYLGVGYENELCKVDLGDRIKQLGAPYEDPIQLPSRR
jgi:hypothetical protein